MPRHARGRAAASPGCSIVGGVPARQSLLLVRRHWRLLAVCVVVCVAAAGPLALAQAPEHEARAQFFVSTSSAGADVGDAYRGELFSQQRVVSYAQLVTSTELLRAVARELRLPAGARQLRGKLRASVPLDTVLIDVTATGASAAESAKAIAEAVSRQLPPFIEGLETPPDASRSPVQVSVTRVRGAAQRRGIARPQGLAGARALAGLVLGLGAVAAQRRVRRPVRDAGAIERIPEVPWSAAWRKPEDRRSLVLLADPLVRRAPRTTAGSARSFARDGGTAGSASLVLAGAGPDDAQASIAANLGHRARARGQRVALVDGNLCAPRLDRALRRSAPPWDSSDVLVGRRRRLERVLVRSPSCLWPSSAPGRRRRPSELLASPRLPALIAELCAQADVVTRRRAAAGVERGRRDVLAAAAQGLLVVVRQGATRSAELEAAAQAPGPLIGAIVNRRPHRRSRAESFAESEPRRPRPRRRTRIRARQLEPNRQVASGRRA